MIITLVVNNIAARAEFT